MIYFGIRVYGKVNLVRGVGLCGHCADYNEVVYYTGRRWFHVYLIPIIPLGGKQRVLNECCRCRERELINVKDVEDLASQIQQNMSSVLAGIRQGVHEYEYDGELVWGETLLCCWLKELYSLGVEDLADGVASELEEMELFYSHAVLRALHHEVYKKYKEAQNCYQEAIRLEDECPRAYLYSGDLFFRYKDYVNAQLRYEIYEKLVPDEINIKLRLANISKQLGNYPKMIAYIETCFEMSPALIEDTALYKRYKKACKKVGKQPLGNLV